MYKLYSTNIKQEQNIQITKEKETHGVRAKTWPAWHMNVPENEMYRKYTIAWKFSPIWAQICMDYAKTQNNRYPYFQFIIMCMTITSLNNDSLAQVS